ncbi:glycosyltransferase family 2 protein [Brachybacterium alimentarium]|uniref:glycosyltransferase family 2 protein n=1 Tax=Brachybacterium alimentarium TaxID=47845 RepID=UPI0015CCA977|nr:glycosyltransferase [Brachybacterium alimentarium]
MTNTSPEVSVVVPSYRGVERLPALFDAFAAQLDGAPSFEIIVVVDGVDDGTSALVRAESRLTARSILFPENRGRAAALNAGFDASRGRVLIRCDDDLVVPRGYISAHSTAHSDDGSVGAVGLTRDIHTDGPYTRAYGEDAARRSLAHALSRPPKERWRLWAASCSITRDTWEKIGPYDARYRGYGWEDVDYGYRLHAAEIPIVVVEEALAEHHGPARSARARAVKAFEAGRARTTFRRLHPDAPVGEPSAGHGPWGLAVGASAHLLSARPAVTRGGAFVDRLLPVVPRPLGRKLVALAVEGAGLAGSRIPSTPEGQH